MSTWISKSALAGVLLLAGCGGLGPSGTAPVRTVFVTTDQVTIAGPDGFCIDPDSTRESDDSAFVLLGNCAVISNRRSAGQPDVNAVLTASISESDPDQSLRDAIPQLDTFFSSDEGRQLLSRAGDAETIELLDSFHQGDVFYLRASDSSASEIQNVSADYWRSYFDIGDRIATLTVLGAADNPIDEETSLATLRAFTDTVLAANLGLESGVSAAPPIDSPAPAAEAPRRPSGNGTLWNVGLFRRIMGN